VVTRCGRKAAMGGVSMRAYARHRGCALFSVQKACRSGRIPMLIDGSIEVDAADRAWDSAAAARSATQRVKADPSRVVLPAGSLTTAEQTVRAVLAEHGAAASEVLTLADVRLAGELLRVQQRSNAIAAQEMECRLRLRMVADEAVDKRIVDALVKNTIRVIWRFVPRSDVPAALETLRDLQAHCLDESTTVE
jgi:hypothetical protein